MTAEKIALPISTVVPCFSRPQGLRNLLGSFREADFSCEIVVVDDCSSVDISAIIAEFSDLDIAYRRNTTNYGPSKSRNIGIAIAKHDLVAFTDDDCRVSSDWLLLLYVGLARSSKNVVGIGGRIVAGGSDVISHYYEYHKILDPWYFKGRFFYLVTANCLFRRAALNKVGGFDENLRSPGGEDPGLCFKLLNQGYRLAYNPAAIVLHDFSPSILSFMRTFFRYGYGCSIQSSRHFKDDSSHMETTFGDLERE
jgi:GT2 family glycosyltransferase